MTSRLARVAVSFGMIARPPVTLAPFYRSPTFYVRKCNRFGGTDSSMRSESKRTFSIMKIAKATLLAGATGYFVYTFKPWETKERRKLIVYVEGVGRFFR